MAVPARLQLVVAAVLALFTLSTLALPLDENSSNNRTAPLPPSQDPFYGIPQNIEYFSPGAIIRHRTPTAPILFTARPYSVESAHQILYRTADRFGTPTATVLTVLVPPNPDFSKVVSYQIAEDAAYVNCAPSYVYQKGTEAAITNGTTTTQLEGLFIEAALEQGWIVIIPDHEGPEASFLVSKAGAQATLDGIRAALQSMHLTCIEPDAAVALWGYSGGSVVSEWATEMQPTYAPEVKIVGAALGGLVPSIANSAAVDNGSLAAGLIPAAFKGMATQYPEVAEELDRLIKPDFKAKFDKADALCLGSLNKEFALTDFRTYFDTPDIFANKYISGAFRDNDLGQMGTPQVPLFIYKAVQDEVSPVADSDQYYDDQCAKGVSIEYVRSAIGNHETELLAGSLRAAAWLRDRLEGKPQSGCNKTTYPTTLLDASQVKFLPADLVATILAFLKIFTSPRTPGSQ
ncbi:hypothetical protein VHEMI09858 [[Torrubiella] hemipterigena]|uniref:Secretory lipase family protein n=1 Tax=[Torrubiella] hemipterigena TaxID=1531966 RepID=A0A0A1TR38_9HYPO|nr:hypothetical protein VHEMI09858 [[Torrubiella] hemipterigena]